jgi:hypothetical protein
MAVVSLNAWSNCAVPLTRLQSHLLRLLANHHSPASDVAGAIALNRDGPRFSGDIDIFHDGDARLVAIAERDAAVIVAADLALTWLPARGNGKRGAVVQGLGETTQLEWVADSAFRFFPTQPDPLFGYVPHPADLATNKASAAADRRVPRDIVDLLLIHDRILPLGAVVTAAVGRFPGMTPEEMLSEIRRTARSRRMNSRRLRWRRRSTFGRRTNGSRRCWTKLKPSWRACRATRSAWFS